MGADKKCQLIVNTTFLIAFSLFFLYLLIANIYKTYKSKNKYRNKLSAWIIFLISLLIISIPFSIIIHKFKYKILFKLIYRKKKSEINKIENEVNGIDNSNNEGDYFMKRAVYNFINTQIKKRNSNKKDIYKKIVSCIFLLSVMKVLF